MKILKKIMASTIAFAMMFSLAACAEKSGSEAGGESKAQTAEELLAKYEGSHNLVLSSVQNGDGSYTNTATLDGSAITEYDYTLHIDPTAVHDEVKDAPAEYYTGTQPGDEDALYIAHDIAYYPELPESDFIKINYDGDPEYAYYYKTEGYESFVFATLPTFRTGFPSQMMHSEEEAYENSVLHITEAGTYIVSGTWHGQLLVDLGDKDDTFTDESAMVKLVLNGADVECTVAPSMIFYSAYECDNGWEDREEYDENVDLSGAGAQVVIADGSTNNFTGANVYRMLKAKFKDEEETGEGAAQKKLRKTDGAFYSYVSIVIDGEEKGDGVLNINATTFEGLDTELHLGLNGGNVNIFSSDDGINCNEDDVSVVAINGGSLHIAAGLGAEGDGIDSNGYLLINGGVVISAANPISDSGLDSSCGSYINGGYVVATGSTMDWPESKSAQATMNLQFAESQSSDEAIIVTDTEGKVVFAYDPDSDEIAGSTVREYRGAVISCPEFEVGSTYNVYVGGNVEGTDTSGIYDASTVKGFDGAVMQQYSSTEDFTGGPGGFGGQMPPDGMNFDGEKPEGMPDTWNMPMERPDNISGGDFKAPEGWTGDGQTPPEKPEGQPPQGFGGQPSQDSNGEQSPDGSGEGQPPQGFGGQPPQDSNGEQSPEGSGEGQSPQDFAGGKGPQGGMTPPDGEMPDFGGGFPGNMGQSQIGQGEGSTEFILTDAVNCFSGVRDKE